MKDQSISRFWDKFSKKSMRYGVKADAVRWMVRHAEGYIKYYPDDRLASHRAEFVTKYLNDKCRDPLLLDWQFRQIILAIRILFTEMVQPDWAENYAWEMWDKKARLLKSSHKSAEDFLEDELNRLKESLNEKNDSANGLFKVVFSEYPHYKVKLLHQRDLEQGYGSVFMPEALVRKYPSFDKDIKWQ